MILKWKFRLCENVEDLVRYFTVVCDLYSSDLVKISEMNSIPNERHPIDSTSFNTEEFWSFVLEVRHREAWKLYYFVYTM